MLFCDVTVKGFKITAENESHELYDFFVPRNQYRMTKMEARGFLPEMHTLIDVKRDSETYSISYEDLIELTK